MSENKAGVLICEPKNLRKVGQEEERIFIYVEDYVMSFVQYLGKMSMEQTKVAVLLGKTQYLHKKPILKIQGAVEIDGDIYGEGCFSKEQWEKIYREIEENFNQVEIVGWVIAKAGLILEPNKEMYEIQKENFHGKEKVLLLYDALERRERFFFMEREKFMTITGYSIYYEKNELMQSYMLKKKGIAKREEVDLSVVENMKSKLKRMEERKRKAKNTKKGVRVTVIAGFLVAGVAFLYNYGETEKIQQVFQIYKGQGQALEQESKIASVVKKEQSEKIKKQSDEEIKCESNLEVENSKCMEKEEGQLQKEEEDLLEQNSEQDVSSEEVSSGELNIEEDTQEQLSEREDTNYIPQYYEIQPGDTLVSICEKNFQSQEKMNEILSINGIQDKNHIVAGTTIKLWE